ncbi:hypothetical protein CR513_21154, partial [Mucuna pruriens]
MCETNRISHRYVDSTTDADMNTKYLNRGDPTILSFTRPKEKWHPSEHRRRGFAFVCVVSLRIVKKMGKQIVPVKWVIDALFPFPNIQEGQNHADEPNKRTIGLDPAGPGKPSGKTQQ